MPTWLAALAVAGPLVSAPAAAQSVPPAASGAPAPGQPAVNQPVVNQPNVNQPFVNQPFVNQPLANQPLSNQPFVPGVPLPGQSFPGQSLPGSLAPSGVQIDPGRVYGDDAPFLGGLGVLAGFGLDISASLATEWSDNFARAADDEPIRNGLESRSDFRFTPSVSVSAGRPLGRQQLFVNATLGHDFYARNTLLNKNRFQIDGGLGWVLGTRCSGRVQGGWSKRGTQLAAFEEVVPSTSERTSFFASAACQTPGGLAPTISYDRYSIRNRTDTDVDVPVVDRSFSDVNSQGITAGLGYTLASRGQVGVQGNWRDLDYPNQFIGPDIANSTKITGANFYANYRLGASIRTNATLGFSKVKPRSGTSPDFSGTVWSIGVDYNGPRLGAGIAAGRNVSGSSGGFGNYQISKFLNANVTYRASDRLSASAGVSRSSNDNRGIGEVPETEVIQSSKLTRFFIGTDYRLNRLLTFTLDLNHQRRSSEPDSFSYDSTSVLFNVRASF